MKRKQKFCRGLTGFFHDLWSWTSYKTSHRRWDPWSSHCLIGSSIPVSRTVGNIVAGKSKNSILAVVACPLLIKLLLGHCNLSIVQEAEPCWIMLLVPPSTSKYSLQITSFSHKLLDVFEDGNLIVQNKVSWPIPNIIMGMALSYLKVD